MSTVPIARTARRLAAEHPAWMLLRSGDAAAAITLLGQHLGQATRHLPETDLVERLEGDIAELRRQGFTLPHSAGPQVSEWLRDGILVRHPGIRADDGSHLLELSDGALAAISFVTRLIDPHPVATPTRLSIVLDALRDLARTTEPDPAARLDALRAERARLDAEIDRLRTGTAAPPDPEHTAERAREILALTSGIPADLLRVRNTLTETDAELRRSLTESSPTRDAFVDDVFRGVDHFAETPAGRNLTEFRARLDAGEHDATTHVTQLLRAPGTTSALTPDEVAALRRIIPDLRTATDDATNTLTTLRRALQRAARTGNLPQEQALSEKLRAAETTALELADAIPPHTPTRLTLKLGSVTPSSPAGIRPHDPADDRPAPLVRPRPPAADAPTDLAALRALARSAEIDEDELRGNVNDVVARRGTATVGEVLRAHPATQGLASIVGLLTLAERHGRRDAGSEDVAWQGARGSLRRARVPRHRFEEPVP